MNWVMNLNLTEDSKACNQISYFMRHRHLIDTHAILIEFWSKDFTFSFKFYNSEVLFIIGDESCTAGRNLAPIWISFDFGAS